VSRPALSFKARGFARRCVSAIASATKVIAFSPFITKCGITEAFAAKGAACTLYTVISARNYAMGLSKLTCLRRLFDAKVQICHIDGLHAKILLLPNELVTIGSQNMTSGGTANREASVFWKDETAAKTTWQAVESWMEAGKPITEALLKRLEETVPKLRGQYRAWAKTAKKVTEDIWEQWRQEEDRKRRAAEAASGAQRRRRWHGFRERFASQVILGEVVRQGQGWSLSNRGQNPAPSYCKWKVDWQQEPIVLDVGKWRPCFHLDTRQWGKARVYREVISFIARDMGVLGVRVGNEGFDLELKCRQSNDDLPQYNLEIDVHHRDGAGSGKILGQYKISSLTGEVVHPDDPEEEEIARRVLQKLADAINSNEDEVQAKLLRKILRSWGKDSLWEGKRVNRFFKPKETIYTGLREVDEHYVLVFSTNPSTAAGRIEQASLFDW
jgi:hypothetical protein